MPMTVSEGGQTPVDFVRPVRADQDVELIHPGQCAVGQEMLPHLAGNPASSRWYEMKMWRWPLMTAGASDSRSEVTATA